MFDLNKIQDMAKLAGEAKKMQERQEALQHEQTAALRRISGQLDQIIALLKEEKAG